MDFLNKLGIFSLIFTLGGLFLVGDKDAAGWLAFCASYILQIYIFWKTKQKFLVVQMILLFLFAVYNFFKWGGV